MKFICGDVISIQTQLLCFVLTKDNLQIPMKYWLNALMVFNGPRRMRNCDVTVCTSTWSPQLISTCYLNRVVQLKHVNQTKHVQNEWLNREFLVRPPSWSHALQISLCQTFAAEKGGRELRPAVDGGLHHQLLRPDGLQDLHSTAVSPGVLQRHRHFLPVVERHAERAFFRH